VNAVIDEWRFGGAAKNQAVELIELNTSGNAYKLQCRKFKPDASFKEKHLTTSPQIS
jgi:hypothetical protein